MPPTLSPFTAMRAFSRFSLPASRLATPKALCRSPIQQHIQLVGSSHSRFSTSSLLLSSPKPLTDAPPLSSNTHKPRPPQPEYQITFTCTPCSTKSTHRISKQGYHHGSVLITCPECRNRHIISDHLNIFGDRNITIEDLMRERGQLVKKGTLSEDGDLEFWEDGTSNKRGESNADAMRAKEQVERSGEGGNMTENAEK